MITTDPATQSSDSVIQTTITTPITQSSDPAVQTAVPVVVQPTTSTLLEHITTTMNNNFEKQYNDATSAILWWEKLNKFLEVCSHILQGTTTILAFLAAALKISYLSILAGCTGVCAGVSMAYSQNCKNTYGNLVSKIKEMENSLGIKNNLPDDTARMNNFGDPSPGTKKLRPRRLLTAYHNQQQPYLPTTASTEDLLPSPTPTPTPNNPTSSPTCIPY